MRKSEEEELKSKEQPEEQTTPVQPEPVMLDVQEAIERGDFEGAFLDATRRSLGLPAEEA